MKISKNSTRPAHIYLDGTSYFITASIWQQRKLLDDSSKTKLSELIQIVFIEYGWKLEAWVILDNHYHLLCHSKKGKDLSKIINKIHSLSSKFIKLSQNIEGKTWSNYWDYCPRDEDDYNIRLCYLLNNPVKHGYVNDLHDWQWSSFHELLKEKGRDELLEKFSEYSDYQTLELFED
jgi:putative transposase